MQRLTRRLAAREKGAEAFAAEQHEDTGEDFRTAGEEEEVARWRRWGPDQFRRALFWGDRSIEGRDGCLCIS